VRRVADFDGPSSLDDVHRFIVSSFDLFAEDHLYAFFLSGKYWDVASEYVDPRSDGRRADKALLFRLGLSAGKGFVYVFDFGSEQRFALTVSAVTEVSAPLGRVVLVESVGALPPSDLLDFGHEADDLPPPDALQPLIPLAQALFAARDTEVEIDLAARDPAEDMRRASLATARSMGEAALGLARALAADLALFRDLDEWFLDQELLPSLLELPAALAEVGEMELARSVAEAFRFAAPDEFNGELASVLAQAGLREEALQQVSSNLENAVHPYVAEGKAGDAYRALGEDDAAEAYYRRSVALAASSSERSEAALRLTSFLIDTGREKDAAAFVRDQRQEAAAAGAKALAPAVSAERNAPCPCGSGKKYKKCHGANA